jgi:Tfp pilus assembly protein PilF
MNEAGRVREIHIAGFLDRVKALSEKSPDSSLLFLLGSGASRQSGIKTGGEMVADWLEMVRKEDPAHESIPRDEWASAARLEIPTFDRTDPAASYPDLFARAFQGRRKEGFDYLEAEIAGRGPSFGYSVLAQIVATTKHKVVVTTNFDNLVIDALSMYTNATPLVCGHESLAGFIRHRPTRPQIVKVHRDLFYAPRNTSEELGRLPEEFAKAIAQLFTAHVPVVIGYGANDGSLMGVLGDLKAGSLPQGVYWCYVSGGPKPRQSVLDLIVRHNGWLVPISGFDELMIRLQNALELEPLDEFLKRRGDERAQHYKERRDALGRELTEASKPGFPTGATASSAAAREQSNEALQALQAVIKRKHVRRTAAQWDSLAKLEADPVKQAQIYEDGLRALPRTAWMAEYAALFFEKSAATWPRASELHERALALAEGDSSILGNYALFLTQRHDYETAETLYKRVVDADPTNASNLNNYAFFLTTIRHDHDAAEAFYRRALAADSTHAYTLGNYANFLADVRHDHDAAEAIYKRAVDADPADADTLGNYARLLLTMGREEEGLAAVKRTMMLLNPGSPVEAECCMYLYCCGPAGERSETLRRLRALIDGGLRTGDWDFSGVIERAALVRHPETGWLSKLANVLSGESRPATLDDWAAWRNAG